MSCNCNCKKNVILVNTITEVLNTAIIEIPETAIHNNDVLKFAITVPIPTSTTGVPLKVMIAVGVMGFSWINHCANAVYLDQLRSRTVYEVKLKTDTLLATNQRRNLNCTDADLPCFPIPTPITVDLSEKETYSKIVEETKISEVKGSDKK